MNTFTMQYRGPPATTMKQRCFALSELYGALARRFLNEKAYSDGFCVVRYARHGVQ